MPDEHLCPAWYHWDDVKLPTAFAEAVIGDKTGLFG
jgi:hypothetical protein